jgi:predicted MFS family arabinose efflux permease
MIVKASAPGETAAATACAGLVALAVAMGVGRFAFTPLLPMMQADVGLSVAAGGWLASANYVGYLVGAVSAMRLRVPVTVAIRGGLVLIGLVTSAMGFVHDFAAWVVLRGLAGVASAWVLIFVSAWSRERLAPARRPILSGVVFGGVGAGIAAVGGICIVLMHANQSAARAWMAFGVLSSILAVAVWPAFSSGHDASPGEGTSAASPAHNREAESVRLILCYGVFGFGYIIPATFLPVMARQAIGDPLIFGWCWPIFGAAALLSTLAAAAFRPRIISNRRLWIINQLVMAFGIALPVLWPGIFATLLAALLVGGTFMVITMLAIKEAWEVAGAKATGLVAAMTSAFAIGQIAGPISVSCMVGTHGGFPLALLVASVLLAISAFALSRHPRP